MSRPGGHRWAFKARFRRHAFGWRSRPAIQRLKEAVAEIKKAARQDAILGAEGAVSLIERLSPALEHVDSSSGAIGTAVNNALAELAPIIGAAPADPGTREGWLERLWEAHKADEIPYIEALADHWGELCGADEVASAWADRLLGHTRTALSSDKSVRGHFHGTSACLSALYRAERHSEIVEILSQSDAIWPYRCWAVRALAAMGRKAEAILPLVRPRGGGVPAVRPAREPGGDLPRDVPRRRPQVPAQSPTRHPPGPRAGDSGRGGQVVRRGEGGRAL